MNLKVSLLVAAIAVAVSGSAVPTSPPRPVAPAKLDNPNLFPVSVFYGKPEHAAQLKDIGVNVYQNAEHDGSSMASITDTGMLVIAGDEWTRAEVGNNAGVVGWSTYDECDMGLGCSGSTTQQNLAQMQQLAATLRSYKDGRPVMANYSKGILGTWWASGTMNGFMSAVDFASADNYAYTSPPVDDAVTASPAWPAGASAATSAAYGWQVDRMRSYQATPGVKPNWVFVESARPYLTESNAKTITPADGGCHVVRHHPRGPGHQYLPAQQRPRVRELLAGGHPR
ncbi:hypothetical protein SB659_13020 [Arthrobacter sp. SIMBA_036]|uniref:hypothetical protein n=1 Tax=Arthrobacter sp. SIMBA_036 TaxID=3085778 RepID=UPI00397D88CB